MAVAVLVPDLLDRLGIGLLDFPVLAEVVLAVVVHLALFVLVVHLELQEQLFVEPVVLSVVEACQEEAISI